MADNSATSMSDSERDDSADHAHPTWRTYALIAVVLTVITAAEVAVYYVPALENMLVPILITLSAAKFLLVVMFYMHLKFDSNIFAGVFGAPFLLAILLVIGMVILFKVL